MLGLKVQEFLNKKLTEHNLRPKVFADQSGLSPVTVFQLQHSSNFNPTIITIAKIANYFNCSTDEVLGRNIKLPENIKYKIINSDEINKNLRQYIKNTLEGKNLYPRQVSTKIGFNQLAISQFIKEDSIQKSMSSALAVALADYFKVPLDEMIGRVEPNQIKYLGANQDKIPAANAELNPPPHHLEQLAKEVAAMKEDMQTIFRHLKDVASTNAGRTETDKKKSPDISR